MLGGVKEGGKMGWSWTAGLHGKESRQGIEE